jgi:plastocyanin
MRSVLVTALMITTLGVAAARAEDASFEITLKDHVFSPAEVKVPAGKPFKLVVKNLDTTPAEVESKPLKLEKVVAGGGTITLSVRALSAGKYPFFDEFNEATAKGTVIAE